MTKTLRNKLAAFPLLAATLVMGGTGCKTTEEVTAKDSSLSNFHASQSQDCINVETGEGYLIPVCEDGTVNYKGKKYRVEKITLTEVELWPIWNGVEGFYRRDKKKIVPIKKLKQSLTRQKEK